MRSMVYKGAVSLFLLGALGGASGMAEPMTANVSVTSNSSVFWVNFVAQTGTFYADQNLTVNLVMVPDIAQQVQQVIGGATDISYTTCEASIRAIDKGAPIAIIGGTMQQSPFTVWGKDIAGARDLSGKTVMLSAPSDMYTVVFDQWVRSEGVDPASIDRVFESATTNRYAALTSGAVAATYLTPPFDFRAEADGMKPVFSYAERLDGVAFVCAVARKDWLEKNAEVAKAQLRAVGNATEFFYKPENRDYVVNALMEINKQEKPLVERTYDYYFQTLKTPFNRGLAVSDESVQRVIDGLLEVSQIKENSRPADFLDMSYAPGAN